jgi:ATP/maltotriose-dependent transcriptional regulator MalT
VRGSAAWVRVGYVRGDLDASERWLTETTVVAPPSEQWIVGVAAIADLSLIAGLRGRRGDQMRLALEAVDLTREVALLDAVEDGEVHTAYGVALTAHGRREEALPERELNVLRHLAGGRSECEIAAELYLSFNTVHSHVKAVYRKLGVSSRADALARSRTARLIS